MLISRPDLQIRPLAPTDCDWVSRVMVAEWGAVIVAAHGEIFRLADLPDFAAFGVEESVGLFIYNITGKECEIVTLDSLREGRLWRWERLSSKEFNMPPSCSGWALASVALEKTRFQPGVAVTKILIESIFLAYKHSKPGFIQFFATTGTIVLIRNRLV